jgi:two-component system aerobic respiration control sensor histidine kinase ArcB
VAPEDTECIFEEFYQGIAADGGKHTGTGLGLPGSRRLARLLGGDIEVDSRVGGGSTFTVDLPDLSGVAGDQGE